MNPTWDILQGDCIEVMRGMEPESVHCVVTSPPLDESRPLRSGVIHGANVEQHVFTLCHDLKGKASSTGAVVISLATMFRNVLTLPQFEQKFCLRSFDSQVRHEAISHICSNQIRGLPDKQRASVASRRLLHPAIATECVLQQIDHYGRDLFDTNDLLVVRVPSFAKSTTVVRTSLDGEVAIGINDTGQVSKCMSIHALIIPRSGGVVI